VGRRFGGEREHAADDHSGGHVENASVPPGQHRSISAIAISDAAQHMAVLAEHDVELVVVEREVFDVSFVKVDRDLGDGRILPRTLQELGVRSSHAPPAVPL
jgi:hypothetical protein